MSRRYLGSWVLPSGNSADVYLDPTQRLECQWDRPPSPAWPAEDIEHWRAATFPEIVRAVATATGQRVLGLTERAIIAAKMRHAAAERAPRPACGRAIHRAVDCAAPAREAPHRPGRKVQTGAPQDRAQPESTHRCTRMK